MGLGVRLGLGVRMGVGGGSCGLVAEARGARARDADLRLAPRDREGVARAAVAEQAGYRVVALDQHLVQVGVGVGVGVRGRGWG